MGVLKRNVDSAAKSGFEVYDGEEPKPGIYRAKVIKAAVRKASTGTLSYNVMYALEALKGSAKSQFDGYTGFCEIWLGDKEALQAREAAFIKATTGKDNFKTANVAYEGKESDFETPAGATITTIDKIKIDGKIVNVDIRKEKAQRDEDGEIQYDARLRADGILPWKARPGTGPDPILNEPEADDLEEDDVDEAEDAEADETDEDLEAEMDERRTELKSRKYGLDKLKEAATAAGANIKGMKKDDLIEAIIAYEFGEDDEEGEEDSEEPEELEEDDIEVDEDEEEEDEEEEDEEDLEAEVREAAKAMDRNELKKAIKAIDKDAKFKTSQSDDDLREIYVPLKLSATPF